MANFLSAQSISTRPNNKAIVLILVVIAVIISLGIISAKTTESVKVSFYHLGEYHLNIRNENGEPVEGAILNVFEKDTKELAFGFPVDNYRAKDGLISNKEGEIIAAHIPRGLEIGSVCYKLFWFYTTCSPFEPDFDFEISADGYQSTNFSTDTLFYNPAYDSQSNGNATLPHPRFKDKWLEVPIYKLTFTLKKKE